MVRRLSALFALSILAGLIPAVSLPAVAAPAVPPPIVKETGTVRGTVADSATGAPIAGACVTIYSRLPEVNWVPPRGTKCTGADGKYEFTSIPLVNVTLGVTAAGYTEMFWPAMADFEVSYGFTLTNGEIRTADFSLTTATTSLSGVVTLPDGSLAPNADVSVYPVGSNGRVAHLRTDANGQFSRTNIAPGTYEFTYWWNSPSRWYGGPGDDRTQATKVTLAAGTPVHLAMHLPAINAYESRNPLTGWVTSQGAAVPGATVTVTGFLGGHFATATTGADGRYSIAGLRHDNYYIRISKPGYATKWAPNTLYPVAVTAPSFYQTELPAGPGTLAGKLTDFDDSAPQGFRIWAYKVVDNAYSLALSVPVNFDGTFELTNVPPGEYVVGFVRGNLTRRQFHPMAVSPQTAGRLTVQSGQRTEIAEKLVPPSYMDVTVTDEETGDPVAGACVPGSVCTGADGRVLVGPLWQVPLTAERNLGVNGGTGYFYRSQSVMTTRGTVTEVSHQLRAGARLEFTMPGKTGLACAFMATSTLGQEPPAHCGEISADGKLILGPIEPGSAQVLFWGLGGTAGPEKVAMQWLTATGGAGQRKQAKVFAFQPRVTTAVTTVDLVAGTVFAAKITAAVPEATGEACVAVKQDLTFCAPTGNAGSALVEVPNIAPYDWEFQYRASGHAPQWSGGASTREKAVPERGGATVALASGGSITGVALPDGSYLRAYDALNGDLIEHAPVFPRSLNTGYVAVRYTGSLGDCWLYDTSGFNATPYWYVRAGSATAANLTVQPGVNCLTTPPAYYGAAPRLDDPAPTNPPVPRM